VSKNKQKLPRKWLPSKAEAEDVEEWAEEDVEEEDEVVC